MDERSPSAFSTDDTIVAIATPPGRGAIGIVRLEGPSALSITRSILCDTPTLLPRHALLARVRLHDDLPGDEVVVTYFASPRSYTGGDVVELSAHGSPVVLQAILAAACRAGARLARPGEFTLRAYLNGKRDLVQAEAVADLVDAVTPLQARAAFDQLQGTLTARIAAIDGRLFDLIARLEASLDFPDEGYHFVEGSSGTNELVGVIAEIDALLVDSRRGRLIREGAQAVISGRVNSGKSLLFNSLLGSSRAIVSDTAGTTRDMISETVDVEGLRVLLVDTAGIRTAEDAVEDEGMRRAQQARAVADLIVLVLDGSQPLQDEDRQLLAETLQRRRLVVVNKSDLPPAYDTLPGQETFCRVSALTRDGLDDVKQRIAKMLMESETAGFQRDPVAITNVRHVALMEDARQHLLAAVTALDQQTPEEFVLSDLQAARAKFDDVVGVRTRADVLAHIFERFCIGK